MYLVRPTPLLKSNRLLQAPCRTLVSPAGGPASYNVVQKDGEFQLSLDLPEVKASDLEVTVQDDAIIHVVGVRRKLSEDGETHKKLRFERTFHVDAQTVNLSELNTDLSGGVLVLTAPAVRKRRPTTAIIKNLSKRLKTTPNSRSSGKEAIMKGIEAWLPLRSSAIPRQLQLHHNINWEKLLYGLMGDEWDYQQVRYLASNPSVKHLTSINTSSNKLIKFLWKLLASFVPEHDQDMMRLD